MSALPQQHRLSIEDVRRMYEVGILGSEERFELIDGVLVKLRRPTPPHSSTVSWLNRHFVRSTDLEVRIQDALIVPGGYFMPDLMVIEPLARDADPTTAVLVIEVSVTSHSHDRWKTERYAAIGVTEYWQVDVPGRAVLVHDQLDAAGYRRSRRVGDGEQIDPPAGATVDVSALLG